MQLRLWAKADGRGKAFDSSAGFVLPNGAMRSPDAAWVGLARLDALTAEQREEFLPLCPEFVIELRCKTDALRTLLDKMREYMENGARLGWLIDRRQRRVYVYRPDQEPQILGHPPTVSGEDVLPGFELDLAEVW
jgi:Uma2 family endonuclease